ncbi:TPA: undecaprenyl-diphosphate phosphatase [Streptococcus equi subsp. zooepidemicus]|uniref:Undecaprenyl-diphosphatase n=1 Tax=Streptococcus equi subsp. zooepidemicus (strain MGCS10565) TaxID=552526 RepID=UPPP_STREM|nr:undecaprenyl-diphosphate phosphatase [Streptococcus equi]B4U4X0.1 RecName: Full=Undecaprenyl-diphosphatase; AltName: Full=Bacitracin resistance protein; AltName: Full=Undecaprenyl pyrophosphate phosphatase [Streptococcus equi subsp. zooepidemicus MGCS10565]ACG63037.1 undecaprenyl-diphosphatase [Streptococcus equi subsp. zooepidemicus MGCS10565]MCD3387831.1 undecaprenyl-diphosphate phosphatase [Streptococcus equi subsp. zooepidemicus]MCD3395695.1 undecaprenyl-diphosphate phosphatase [Streptoc
MLFIELLKAIFFGVIEGVTEWLPISSTGHLILVQEFIRLHQDKAFMEMFNIVIQLGAIIAVIVIYFERLNPFQPGKSPQQIRLTWQLWLKVAIACIPSIIIAVPLDDWFDVHFNHMLPIAIALIVYGIAFLWIEKRNQTLEPRVVKLSRMSYKTAFFIGCFQVLSIIPGTSRSGATILGAIILGASRTVAADFTFFLAIPTMFGYSGLKALKFFIDGNHLTLSQLLVLLVASLTAFAVSLYVIKLLTDYVKKHDFTVFGRYRIVLGSLLIVYSVFKSLF